MHVPLAAIRLLALSSLAGALAPVAHAAPAHASERSSGEPHRHRETGTSLTTTAVAQSGRADADTSASGDSENISGSGSPLHWGLGVGASAAALLSHLRWRGTRIRVDDPPTPGAGGKTSPPPAHLEAHARYLMAKTQLWTSQVEQEHPELLHIRNECLKRLGFTRASKGEQVIFLDKCHQELLRDHRDKMSPPFLRDLSALRTYWVSLYPQIEPLIEPDPLSDATPNADGRNGGEGSPPPSPPPEQKSMMAAIMGHPAVVPKVVSERLAQTLASLAGVGSSGAKRFGYFLPGAAMMGRRSPRRF